ncbi:hypothetical protein JFL47_10315 [Haemophilus haemoglobinophilus]|nr:hypothetical protein [Canicola haemoglobinophilus]MBN6711610.1 hypothetical protein [Canicola haemoglobinophilus]
MKLKNPFALIRKLRQYKALCKRQCLQLTAYNEICSELMAEKRQLEMKIIFLESEVKIAREKLQLAVLSTDLFQQK